MMMMMMSIPKIDRWSSRTVARLSPSYLVLFVYARRLVTRISTWYLYEYDV